MCNKNKNQILSCFEAVSRFSDIYLRIKRNGVVDILEVSMMYGEGKKSRLAKLYKETQWINGNVKVKDNTRTSTKPLFDVCKSYLERQIDKIGAK